MPRITSLSKNYIEPKLAELLGGLVFRGKTSQKEIAEALGVSQPSVSKKLHSGNLTAKELIIILKVADADEEDWERISKIYR